MVFSKQIFGEKVLKSVLCWTNYVRALRGLLILQYAIENVKQKAFWKCDIESIQY